MPRRRTGTSALSGSARTANQPAAPRTTPSAAVAERLEPRTLLSLTFLKDINLALDPVAANPRSTVDLGGVAFFEAGGQVWKSDGAAAGTAPVTTATLSPDNLTVSGGLVYFRGAGGELYRSDGTAGGTRVVRDIFPGGGASDPRYLTDVGGTLFFVADDGARGLELWRSDGTEAGTVLVRDTVPGAGTADPRSLTAVGSTLYFVADDGAHGYELWKSDGTAAGTVMVRDVFTGPGTSAPANLVDVNGSVFFSASAGAGGLELWKSDGTEAGTTRVRDINPGDGGSSPAMLTNADGTLYFTANDGATGDELWRSDGTAAGTVCVADLTIGAAGSGIDQLASVGGRLFFAMYRPATGIELWTSDGTAAGTAMLRDQRAGTESFNPKFFTALGDSVYFSADDGVRGRELWRSDGTPAGTTAVTDLRPGGSASSPHSLAAVGGSLFFSAMTDDGWTLFRAHGASGTVAPVRRVNPGLDPNSSAPRSTVTYNGAVYFAADDGVHGRELWRTDGTPGGTVMVRDITPGAGGSHPSQLTVVGDTLYLVCNGQLWRSDGTAAGTAALSNGVARALTPLGSVVYFIGSDSAAGEELWRTDGTPAGTVRLTDLTPGPAGSRVNALTPVGGERLFFVANDGLRGDELWMFDANAGSARIVRDLVPGPVSGGPWLLTPVGQTLFFRGTNGTGGWELWRTDGTHAGTTLVKDVLPGDGNSGLAWFASMNGALFFTASDGVSGMELWRSDGTAAGTQRVADVWPGAHGSSPANLTVHDGLLYFRADDGVAGQELWVSDGTAAGTRILHDLFPGPGDGVPHDFRVVDGRLMFRASPHAWVERWWVTDGTAVGTQLAFGDAAWVMPGDMAYLNGAIIFGAYLDGRGDELWRVGLAGVPLGVTGAPSTAATAAVSSSPPSVNSADGAPAPAPDLVAATHATAVAPTAATPTGNAIADGGAGVYDALISFWRPRMGQFGVAPAHVNGGDLWPGMWPFPDREAPDEAAVRQLANATSARGENVLIPDVEHWPVDVRSESDGLVQMSIERFGQIVDWIHDEQPGMQVGVWSMLPLADYWTPVAGSPAQNEWWAAANARLQPLAHEVDVIFPSLYAFYEDRAGWTKYAQATLAEAARYGKPIAPFVWPQYHNATPGIALQHLPVEYWRHILQTASAGGNDVVIWGMINPSHLPVQWDDATAWWSVTRDWLVAVGGAEPESPVVVQHEFRTLAADHHELVVWFNKRVGTSIAAGDLSIRLAAADDGPITPQSVDYDPASNAASFRFDRPLQPGEYEATLPDDAVLADDDGHPMPDDHRHRFLVGVSALSGIEVNGGGGGAAQRSMLTSVVVRFAEPVTLGTDAFTLAGRNGAGAGTHVVTANPSGDRRSYVLSFVGPAIIGGSLPDGVYDLTVVASQVWSVGAASSGPLTADVTFALHRLFSDADGDGDSDNADAFQLRGAHGKQMPDPAYRWWWDYDADGDVDNADAFQIRGRRNTVLTVS